MKKMLLIIFLIFIVGVIIISLIMVNKNVIMKTSMNDKNIPKEVTIIPIPEKIADSQMFNRSTVNADLTISLSDNQVIADESEFIIIGTIKSIDGSVNYNPTTQTYTMIQTVGELKVDKVLKGEINEKQIPFIRVGGTITVSEYEKGLKKELAELYGMDKLTKKEKDNKYIEETMVGDITLEKNKTYLLYLNYYEDFNRYGISWFEYGTKEIDANSLSSDANITNSDTETLTKDEYKTIKVKNNENGNYETLDSIIPDKVKKVK